MVHSRKSQAGVIVTVLLILVSIAAVFIVYTTVKKIITSNTENAASSSSLMNIQLENYCSNLSKSIVNVSVIRKAGQGNVTGFKVVFSNSSGSWTYENRTNAPAELETKVYSINMTNSSSNSPYITNIKSCEVFPIVNTGTKEVTGLKATPVSSSSGGGGGGGGGTPGGAGTTYTFYRDFDGDTYGNSSVTVQAATAPANYTNAGGDCNDNNPNIWQILSGYRDADNDNYGNGSLLQVCSGATLLTGYSSVNADCNDNNGAKYPNAAKYSGVLVNGNYTSADFDGNGAVDTSDYLVIKYNYDTGCIAPTWCNLVDINRDGSVTVADHNIFDAAFGKTDC